ncbi:hypothetical protein RB195_011786 [Necator americanus]|uniref:Reverse transcriptase domain-containing protein n=1 Tax=Necator americanus TaxID=51031 RepID=A0ABR1D410_NECAM
MYALGTYELYNLHCYMAKASHTLQKGAVVQHTAKAHNLKGQLLEGSMESLAATIRFVTLNCRPLSSELQQAALSRLLRYLCVPFAALQETRMRDRPVISIENYTIYCGDADEIKDAARETLPVLLPRKKFAFASAKTKSTYNSVCVARSAGDFNQEKRLRRKLRRQLQQDRDTEWTSRAMEFEKTWEDRNSRKAYAVLKQYSGKMKRCFPVLNTANGVAVGEATLPIWKEHFKTLLNRLAPSASELKHVHRPTYAVNEGPPTESEVLVCIQKMKNRKSGGDDRISAEMLKYFPPSEIREMTKIIRSIWIDERIPDSWRHAIIIPLHKKLSVTDPRNYRGISLLRVMYKVLDRIILDRFIKHREETTGDEQAGFHPGRSTMTRCSSSGE